MNCLHYIHIYLVPGMVWWRQPLVGCVQRGDLAMVPDGSLGGVARNRKTGNVRRQNLKVCMNAYCLYGIVV